MSGRAHARRAATYEDILALPEHQVGEIIAGELIVSPRPAGPHTYAGSQLGGELMGPFSNGKGGPGGWWVLSEPELHLGEDVFVPDWAAWKKERLPTLDVANFTVAPDWVCEILSPSNRKTDLELKLPRYARRKVAHAWILDPDERSLTIYERESERWVLVKTFVGEEKVRARPFEAIELDLALLWLPEKMRKNGRKTPKSKRT